MTLEEEIMKLDLIASDAFEGGDVNEFRQFAEWLRELKRWRKLKSIIIPKYRDGVSDEYNRGANDMWKEVMERIEEVNNDYT